MDAKGNSLKFPNKVVVHLVDLEGRPVHLAGVVFEVHLFATRKNDFQLAPFASDAAGTVTIERSQMNALVLADYDSGLMDYASVETCRPQVEIRLWSKNQVDLALAAREKVWRHLLKGETDIWNSIEELKNIYRTATNVRLEVPSEGTNITDQWDGRRSEYEYTFPVNLRT